MLQYRASLFIWMIGQVLEPLIYLVVWSTVSASRGGSVGDYTAAQFAAYYIAFMLVNQMTYTWIMWEYEYRIREGMLSPALLRPVHPIHADIAENISSKLVSLPVMLLIAAGLALIFKPSASPQLWALLAFIPAVLLAFLLRFLVEWTLAQAAFWTTRVSAINQVYFVLILFLSGQIAPLSLFPAPIQLARQYPAFPLDDRLSGRAGAGPPHAPSGRHRPRGAGHLAGDQPPVGARRLAGRHPHLLRCWRMNCSP